MSNEGALRHEICEVGRRVYAKGYVASNDGNITARLTDDIILATPTGVSKGVLTPDMLCKVNLVGEQVEGYLKASSEIRLHLHCYRKRPDVRSVLHAHPPIATGFAVAGIALDQLTLPETIVSFGCIPLAPYGTPGSQALPDSIDGIIETCDAILLANHGAVTVGADPMSAYYKMETMEHTAHITWVARSLGGERELTADQANQLLELRDRLGYGKKVPLCDVTPRMQALQAERERPAPAAQKPAGDAELTALITRVATEVLKERGLL
ncbi:class II aldolase/adducin family protein [Candidatus Poribacteria bacterium]|nr:class II aldolase/adducin family protein [Candidatus Poribacteria bacterium]